MNICEPWTFGCSDEHKHVFHNFLLFLVFPRCLECRKLQNILERFVRDLQGSQLVEQLLELSMELYITALRPGGTSRD